MEKGKKGKGIIQNSGKRISKIVREKKGRKEGGVIGGSEESKNTERSLGGN